MKDKELKKISRPAYTVMIVFLLIAFTIVFTFIGVVVSNENIMGVLMLLLFIVSFIIIFTVTRHRLNDINIAKGLAFILLIPTVNIIFMIILCALPSDLIGDKDGQGKRETRTRQNSRQNKRSKSQSGRKYYEPKKISPTYSKPKTVQHREPKPVQLPIENEAVKKQLSYEEFIKAQPRVEKSVVTKEARTPEKARKTNPKELPRKKTLSKPVQENKNMNTVTVTELINISGITKERANEIIKVREKTGRFISAYDLSLRLELTPEERKIIENKCEFRL